MTPQALVYTLCLLTSLLCCSLLVRAYLRTKARLLLWSSVSFVFLAINNCFLVADIVLFPNIDLLLFRDIAMLAAIGSLIYGFIWEAE